MPQIKCQPLNKTIEADSSVTLMSELLKNNIPVASSCGGEGICKKCVVEVIEGVEFLTPPTELEKAAMMNSTNHRLSCQTCAQGDLTLSTGYW